MSGTFSILSRAVWAFIVLSGTLVAVVATTDHPLAWRFMSLPGLLALLTLSLWAGWLLRTRAAKEPTRVAVEPKVDPPSAEASTDAPAPMEFTEPDDLSEPVSVYAQEPPIAPQRPDLPLRRPVPEAEPTARTALGSPRREPSFGGKPKQVRTPMPEPRKVVSHRAAPRANPDLWNAAPRMTRDLPEEQPPANGTAAPNQAARVVVNAFKPIPVAAAKDRGRYRRPAPIGDAKVDIAFDINAFEDQRDERGIAEIPELGEAEALRGSDDRAGALTRLGEILALYPDYAPLYLMLAELLHEAGRPDARDAILENGLATARQKAELLAAIGDYASYEGRMADAVPWLVRSAALQLGGGVSSAPQAFSLLAGLCDPHASLARARLWLLRQLETRDPDGDFRLDEVAKGRLHVLSKSQSEDFLIESIERLWRFYSSEGPSTEPPVLLLKPRNSPSPVEHHHRPRALQ